QGVPMIQAGDELWRTQRGNNNAYCQDSELTWIDWSGGEGARTMLELARALTALRRRFAVVRRPSFLTGEATGVRPKDVVWLRLDGAEMTLADWQDPQRAVLAFRLEGDAPILVLMNAEASPLVFRTPPADLGAAWRVVLDTGAAPRGGAVLEAGRDVALDPGT